MNVIVAHCLKSDMSIKTYMEGPLIDEFLDCRFSHFDCSFLCHVASDESRGVGKDAALNGEKR